MRIADKVQYWEELEETEEIEEQESMDTEDNEEMTEKQHSNTLSKAGLKQAQQEGPQDSEDYEERKKTGDNIRARQERLENNMEEMIEILGKIAGRFEKYSSATQKPGQKGSSTNQKQ